MADLVVHDTDQAPGSSAPATPSSSRRQALRDTLVAAGLVATAATALTDRGPRALASAATPEPGVHALTLTATDLHTDAGGWPEPGQTVHAYATLTGPHGAPAGRFFATIATIDDPADDDTLAQETHTFVLEDATIVGSGVSTIDDEQPDTFAIIGGTGRYLGARGQYTAVQRHADLTGDGTASYEMTIIVDQLAQKGN